VLVVLFYLLTDLKRTQQDV